MRCSLSCCYLSYYHSTIINCVLPSAYGSNSSNATHKVARSFSWSTWPLLLHIVTLTRPGVYCAAMWPSKSKTTPVKPCGYSSCFRLPTTSRPRRFASSTFQTCRPVTCLSISNSRPSAIRLGVFTPLPTAALRVIAAPLVRWLVCPKVRCSPMQLIILALHKFRYRFAACFGVYRNTPIGFL